MKKRYIALTVGPIYKTLLNAKKTGELWSGSYIFSYIMKSLVKEFKNKKEHIVLPVIEDNLFKDKKEDKYKGAGFFPDRFIFESQDGDLEKLKNNIDETIKKLANDIYQHLDNVLKNLNNIKGKDNIEFYKQKRESLSHIKNKTEKDVENYLKEYFQIYFFEKEVENPIKDLYPILDMFELQQNVIYHDEINYLSLFMQNINDSFLKKDASIKNQKTFPSIPYIATKIFHNEINNLDEIFNISNDDTKIYDLLKEKVKIKNHHKYIAIVQADGDNIGSIIGSFKNNEYQDFNKKLLKFTTSSNKAISKYDGALIYAGGDDLLFFAPIVSKEGHIFELLKEIRDNFEEELKDEIEKIKNHNLLNDNKKNIPSISFGLSISYYKYPLYEALQNSIKTLDISKDSGKNSITVNLLQHSGQYVQTTMKHSDKSYEEFENLTNIYLSIKDKKSILSSFHHTIRKFEDVLKAIGKDREAINNLFENNFNDSHKKQYEKFTKILVNYIQMIFSEEDDEKKAIDRLYTSLKIIKFLKGEEI